MERHYTTALTYVRAPAASTLDDRCEPEVLQYYTIGTSNVGGKTYTVSAAIVSGVMRPFAAAFVAARAISSCDP